MGLHQFFLRVYEWGYVSQTHPFRTAPYIWQTAHHWTLEVCVSCLWLLCPTSPGRQVTHYEESLGDPSPQLCPSDIAEGLLTIHWNHQAHVGGSGAPVMGGWLQNWRIQCRRTQFRGHWTSLPQESQGCGNQCKSLCDTGRPRYKSIHKNSSVGGEERLTAEKHKHFCM